MNDLSSLMADIGYEEYEEDEEEEDEEGEFEDTTDIANIIWGEDPIELTGKQEPELPAQDEEAALLARLAEIHRKKQEAVLTEAREKREAEARARQEALERARLPPKPASRTSATSTRPANTSQQRTSSSSARTLYVVLPYPFDDSVIKIENFAVNNGALADALHQMEGAETITWVNTNARNEKKQATSSNSTPILDFIIDERAAVDGYYKPTVANTIPASRFFHKSPHGRVLEYIMSRINSELATRQNPCTYARVITYDNSEGSDGKRNYKVPSAKAIKPNVFYLVVGDIQVSFPSLLSKQNMKSIDSVGDGTLFYLSRPLPRTDQVKWVMSLRNGGSYGSVILFSPRGKVPVATQNRGYTHMNEW